MLLVHTILAEQQINEGVNRYLLPATISFKKCLSIPITSNNRSPIGIGSYRLSIDLEPIVQGVVYSSSVGSSSVYKQSVR